MEAVKIETRQLFEVKFLLGTVKHSCVSLACSYTKWQEKLIPMERVNDAWEVTVFLPQGRHYFKFVRDHEWDKGGDQLLDVPVSTVCTVGKAVALLTSRKITC
jgi:hypothetical protein